MIQGLLGKKIKMTRWFDSDGKSVPVTLISCGPCYIIDKSEDSLTIGYNEVKEKKLSKPEAGVLKKKNLPPLKYIKKIKWLGKKEDQPEIGSKLYADAFQVGEMIDVQGTSKGKGFAGVVKRWGFRGGPATHGAKFHRAPGSVGASSFPSRTFPGMRMAGRKGGTNTTVQGLKVVELDKKESVIAVMGSVPGPNSGMVFIKRSVKAKKGKK
ncbi:MAG: 50S ribosomal protein L3 [Elusimicrobia bacterium]|nr:50S ribosomal protein L3 [Elusimicrobiota bacterium]